MTGADQNDAGWRWIEHEGMAILELDLRACSSREATRRLQELGRVIATLPEKSVLCLTLAWGVRYDPRNTKAFVQQMRENDRHLVASAVVGLDHLTRLVNVLNRLSGRSVRAFDDVESALAWLVSQRSSSP